MIVFKDIYQLKKYVALVKSKGLSIGFVPTMGALHQGHLSLVDLSNNKSDMTVVSIFINPTQFNDPADFEKYPVTVEADSALLEVHQCDVLFLPSIAEMYPGGIKPDMHYDLGDLESTLEGKFRPGHFQGVAQVVHRLLNIVEPDYLFLGSKDYQQCMVLKKLVKFLNANIEVITGETLREASGLAMSSRNLRLSEKERLQAANIYQALAFIKDNIQNHSMKELEQLATDKLLNNGFSKVDYVAIADAQTLSPEPNANSKLVALVAAYIGNVRLIDNMVLS